jgi:nicotinamide-nucleotide amidase
LAAEPFRRLTARAERRGHRVLRFFGVPEAAVAEAVAVAGGEREGLELTVCARNFEIEVDLFFGADGSGQAEAVSSELVARFGDALFARDERPVAEIVLDRLRGQGLTLAAAESCTGGLLGAMVTAVAGASDVFRGGVVSYADDVKRGALGVRDETLASHGAVSAQVAAEMAAGARQALGADVAVAVTGVAGPGGGTEEKPVGLVHVHVSAPEAECARELRLYGGRDEIRTRASVAALHEVRRVLAHSGTHARDTAT